MTSKEALLKIEAYLAYDDFQEELKAIAKDLEVLEILKKLFTLEYDVDFYLNRIEAIPNKMIISGSITREELNKIEEWLHNE